MIRASIVILTNNAERWVDEVFGAVFEQDFPDTFEVLHLDTGSTDRTIDLAARFPCRQAQIPSSEFSYSGTRNLGARLSHGEFVVFLNQDVTPVSRDWLTSLIAPFEDPSVAGAFGRQIPRPTANVVESNFLRRTYDLQRRVKKLPTTRRLKLEDFFFSSVVSVLRKSVWERYPYDERLYFAEDQCWARDVLRAGYSIVYEPTAAVWHSNEYTLVQLLRRYFDVGHCLEVVLRDEDPRILRFQFGAQARRIVDFMKSKPVRYLPYFAAYEFVRALGFGLGKYWKWLPRWLCRMLTNHPKYWDGTSQSGSLLAVSSAELRESGPACAARVEG